MSLLKENKIYLHGFTDSFTYNNVDYSLSNYDKDMYELYFKEVQNENVKLMCDLLEFKEDVVHCSKIRQLTKASYYEMKYRYDSYLNRFELHKAHFVVNLFTQDDTRDFYKVIDTLRELWMMVEMYVISKCFTLNSNITKEPKPYVKFLNVEEVPGRFTNTLKKLEESVLRGKLKKVIIENLKKY